MGVRWMIAVTALGLLPGLVAAQEPKRFVKPPDAARGSQDAPLPPSIGPMAPPTPADQAEPVPIPQGEIQGGAGMTLAELEAMAERCNPTLVQASARVQAARGQYQQVGLYPNPVVGYQASEMGQDGRAGQQGGFIGQELVTAGKLRLNRAVAAQEIQQAQYAWQAQRFRVLTDVRRGFYEVLAAQRAVELTEQLLGISEQGVRAAEQLLKAKEAARTDVLQARIEADSARILLEKARNRYTGAWRSLAAVVGDPALQPTPLAGSLQDGMVQLTWEDTLNRLLATSPQLAGAQTGVARARAAVNREFAGRIPNVEYQVGVQYDNATGYTIANAGLAVPLPIYNRNQGNIRRAQAELTAAQYEVNRVRLALGQRLAAVFEQYATAHQQVEKYTSDILPNAQESLKLVSSGYRQGEFGYLVLLTAQRTYFQTNLAYLDALRDLRTSAAAIEGYLLTDSLQSAEPAVGSTQQR